VQAIRETEAKRWTVDGHDLRDAYRRALLLPALESLRGRQEQIEFTLRRGKSRPGSVSGRALPGPRPRFVLTVGIEAQAQDAVGVLIHELAHLACWFEGEDTRDAAPSFARRCHDALDEWNDRRELTLDRTRVGAYRGTAGKSNRDLRQRRLNAL